MFNKAMPAAARRHSRHLLKIIIMATVTRARVSISLWHPLLLALADITLMAFTGLIRVSTGDGVMATGEEAIAVRITGGTGKSRAFPISLC